MLLTELAWITHLQLESLECYSSSRVAWREIMVLLVGVHTLGL